MNARASEWTLSYLASGAVHGALLGAMAFGGVTPPRWQVSVDAGKASAAAIVMAADEPEETAEVDETALLVAAPLVSDDALEPQLPESPEQVVEPLELADAASLPPPKRPQPKPAAAPRQAPILAMPERARPKPPVETPPPQKAETTLVSAPTQAGAQVEELPQKLPNNPAPTYPRDALAARIGGRVVVRATVGIDGLVQRVALETSAGHASLDAAALATVRRWQFSPGKRGGMLAACDVLVPVRFVIRS